MAMSSPRNALLIFTALLLLSGGAPAATKKSVPKPAAKRAVSKPKPAPAPTPAPLAPGELPLTAKSAIVLDAQTGNILYEKAPDEMQYPASTTKILTALLVIEEGDLDKKIIIDIADTKVESRGLDFKPGEEFTRMDFLYALLLESANDGAAALARDNAGSIAAFAEKMNRRAEALGAKSSHFTNPHGLPDPHHFTTARDLALIARFAMQNPIFREIVATPQFGLTRGDKWVVFKNHNRLLGMLPGCIGVKTGYTFKAQQVLVSSAIRAGHEAIAIVMHADKPGIWNDSKTLLEHAFEKLGVPPPIIIRPPAPLTPAPNPAEVPRVNSNGH